MPANILIPGGATTAMRAPQVNGIDFGSAVITASAFVFPPVSQTVQSIDTITFSPANLSMAIDVNGPHYQNLLLGLSAPAPAAGLTVNLNSDNPSIASVPQIVTFTPGASWAGYRCGRQYGRFHHDSRQRLAECRGNHGDRGCELNTARYLDTKVF
jgi:hypothetical protein